LYALPNIIGVIKTWRVSWTGHVARMGAMTNAYNIFVVKCERKRPLGGPRRRWNDNIKMDSKEL